MTTDQPAEQERTVTITLRQYMSLYKDSATLGELESAGVDNWDGYDCINHGRVRDTCRTERTRIINGEDPRP